MESKHISRLEWTTNFLKTIHVWWSVTYQRVYSILDIFMTVFVKFASFWSLHHSENGDRYRAENERLLHLHSISKNHTSHNLTI